MTLTTHAVVGAAVASLVPAYPVLGFAAAFVSHFAIDAIPHWDEGQYLRSTKKDVVRPYARDVSFGRGLVHDFLMVGADSLIGFILAGFILSGLFSVPMYLVLLGAFAAQVPDGLQFIYFVFKPKVITPLQHFHAGIQKQYPDLRYLGIEVGIIACVILAGILGVFVL